MQWLLSFTAFSKSKETLTQTRCTGSGLQKPCVAGDTRQCVCHAVCPQRQRLHPHAALPPAVPRHPIPPTAARMGLSSVVLPSITVPNREYATKFSYLVTSCGASSSLTTRELHRHPPNWTFLHTMCRSKGSSELPE